MKKRQLSIILVTLLFITLFTDAFAAVIDVANPYEGDYLLAINTSTDSTTTQYSGNMSTNETNLNNPQLSVDSVSTTTSNPNVTNIREENGLKMEQIDPGDMLEKLYKPNEANSNQTSILKYSDTYAVQYNVGAQRIFKTADFRYDPPQTVTKAFTLMYSGTKCNIWLENGGTVNLTSLNISSLGSEFDTKIYTNMTTNFGSGYDKDGDGKTAIMLYDIPDGWNGTTVTWYYGGFFSAGELDGSANNMDVIHIDTYPSMGTNKSSPDFSWSKSCIAHEYQHFINYSYSRTNGLAKMPTWLNEGLSMAAEDMLYGTLSYRIDNYNISTYIRDGQSLFDWDNGDNMSNYALAYLFMQYLRTQTKSFDGGGTAIYNTLIKCSNRTATAVQTVMKQFYPSITLDEIQMNFRIATILKEPTGAYGFMGETAFNSVSPLLYTGSGTNLRGGGALIKAIYSPFTPSGFGANVKFRGFKREKVATPVPNIASGTVVNKTELLLSCATNGATIRYTTDGSTPTIYNGTFYSSPIIITNDVTIKAMAYNNGMADSDVASFAYTVIYNEVLQKQSFGGSNADQYNSVICVDDGYVAVGYSNSSSFGNNSWAEVTGKGNDDAIIVKFDTSGNVVWRTNFGGLNNDKYTSITSVGDGYIAVGNSAFNSFSNSDWTGVTGKGSYDAIIVKYNTNGNVLWKKNFGGSDSDYYNTVTAVNDGVIVVGYSSSASFGNGDWTGVTGKGSYDAIIVKYGTNGDVLWKKNFGGSRYDYFNSVATVNDGFITVGYSDSASFGNGDWTGVTAKGSYDAIAVKYDTNGDVVWKKNFGGSDYDCFNSVTTLEDGFVAVGNSNVPSFGNGDWTGVTAKGYYDAIIVKYDKNGNVVWKKNFGGSDNEYYNSVSNANDGYIAVGYSTFNSFNNGDWIGVKAKGLWDAIIVKYDIMGNVVWKKSFGGSSSDCFNSVAIVNDGFCAVGYSDFSSFGNNDWAGVSGKGGNDATIARFSNADTLPVKSLRINSYNIYNGTTLQNIFPQSAGIYTVKAQYINTKGNKLTTSFILTVKSNNKLLKTYIIPKTVEIDKSVTMGVNFFQCKWNNHPRFC